MWDDDGDGLLCVAVGVHANVRDEIAGFVDRFKSLECDVFTSFKFYEVFNAVYCISSTSVICQYKRDG